MPPRRRYASRTPLPPPAAPAEWRALDAVRDLVHASVTGESAEEALQFALDRMSPQLGAALGSVYLVDGASELMRLVAAHEWPERYRPWLGEMRVRVGFGPSGEAASERRVIDVPDVFADPDLEDWHDVARELGFAALIALPLVAAGRVLGVATFYFREMPTVTPALRSLLRLVADLLAGTADQAARRDDLRRANAALQEATREVERHGAAVEQARQARDGFLEGVSNDLRAPLEALRGQLEQLEASGGTPLNQHQGNAVRAAHVAAARAIEVVETLRDFAGARHGALELHVEDCDPRVPLRDAVRQIRSPMSGVVVAAVEPVLALPPMRGDRRKIVRQVAVLAGHYLEHGHLDRVELTVEAGDGRVRYRIQEAGGVRADVERSVEDADAPLPSQTQAEWALDLVRRVAQAMGGTVAAEAAGEGRTAFVLDLPLNGPPSASVARG